MSAHSGPQTASGNHVGVPPAEHLEVEMASNKDCENDLKRLQSARELEEPSGWGVGGRATGAAGRGLPPWWQHLHSCILPCRACCCVQSSHASFI